MSFSVFTASVLEIIYFSFWAEKNLNSALAAESRKLCSGVAPFGPKCVSLRSKAISTLHPPGDLSLSQAARLAPPARDAWIPTEDDRWDSGDRWTTQAFRKAVQHILPLIPHNASTYLTRLTEHKTRQPSPSHTAPSYQPPRPSRNPVRASM